MVVSKKITIFVIGKRNNKNKGIMNVSELKEKLNEIRTEAVNIIKGVMDAAGITDLNLDEAVGTGDYPLVHNQEGEGASIARIYIEDDSLWFESDTETMMDTIYDGEDDLSVDELLDIAEWMQDYEDDIKSFAEEE